MKPLRTLLIASFATVFFSCGNSQQATTASINNTPYTKGTIREVANMEGNSWNNETNETASTDNDIELYWIELNKKDWIKLKKKDMTPMYDYVNMSEDQILKYQRGYVGYINNMQNKHIRKTLDQKDLLKLQDGILYDILIPAQYDKYQEWKRKNQITKL
ncbi:hypothetical protein [Aequorivita lipolytica]|uniref:Uncharacterized protein n=1 Tax=Aequorivita lipolytica TaxID=153267 RepID=A0A5C6YSN9_9FLAO|nr:hypothetical protein [Aequorivita lipolytica]TXD70053.1 hypothetical protein ESV24_02460 [Aequorivita lipolytica]SRX50459.1 hypothetical protein AEQU2_00932 [Aequorivita lipolytica]